jgi:hypothetical protein
MVFLLAHLLALQLQDANCIYFSKVRALIQIKAQFNIEGIKVLKEIK